MGKEGNKVGIGNGTVAIDKDEMCCFKVKKKVLETDKAMTCNVIASSLMLFQTTVYLDQ